MEYLYKCKISVITDFFNFIFLTYYAKINIGCEDFNMWDVKEKNIVERGINKILEKNNVEKTPESIAEALGENSGYGKYNTYVLSYMLDKLGVDYDAAFIDELMKQLENYPKFSGYYTNTLLLTSKLLKLKAQKESNIEKITDFLAEVGREERYKVSYDEGIRYFRNEVSNSHGVLTAYESICSEEMKHDKDFIINLLSKRPDYIYILYKYIDKKDIFDVLDVYYIAAYRYIKNMLTPEERKFVVQKILDKGGIYLVADEEAYPNFVEKISSKYGNDLLGRLRKRYGKKYEEVAKKKNIDASDNVLFMYNILNSTVLEQFYINKFFTIDDVKTLDELMSEFARKGYDCEKMRERDSFYFKKTKARELGIYNYIASNKDNHEALDKLAVDLKLDKDNFGEYIRSRKFLSKELKEASLLILSKHFNTGYISIYDIIDLLQEMTEYQLTIDEILEKRNIDKELFYKIYNNFIETNPDMYQLIRENLRNNSIRGFKKLLKLYYSIMESDISNLDSFVKKYQSTPEEILELFKYTDLYDSLYQKLSAWYKFEIKADETKKNADSEVVMTVKK